MASPFCELHTMPTLTNVPTGNAGDMLVVAVHAVPVAKDTVLFTFTTFTEFTFTNTLAASYTGPPG